MEGRGNITMKKTTTFARWGKLLVSLLLTGVILLGCASCKTTMLIRFQDQNGNIIGNSGDSAAQTPAKTPVETPAQTPAADPATAAPAQSASASAEVSSINLELDEGILKYVRFEKASTEITDVPNAYLFVFEYTNKQSEPANATSTFVIQYFQNGAELSDPMAFTVKGEQGELASAKFNQAMQGGTVTFGDLVHLKDESPVTIYVKQNGNNDNHQSMVVQVSTAGEAPTAAPTTESSKKEHTAEEIDALIQGTWVLLGNNYFTFDHGKISIVMPNATMNGTYTIDTSNSIINGTMQATNGTANMQLHYGFSTDGDFVLFNNNNIGLVKQ